MKKQKVKNETYITIKTETREEFFARGLARAKLLDSNQTVPYGRTISFEDSEDLVQFLTISKLALLAAIRKKPASISALAGKLHRSRAAIMRDVQLLESVGIVVSEYVINAGHGRCRIIKAADKLPVRLHVETVI